MRLNGGFAQQFFVDQFWANASTPDELGVAPREKKRPQRVVRSVAKT